MEDISSDSDDSSASTDELEFLSSNFNPEKVWSRKSMEKIKQMEPLDSAREYDNITKFIEVEDNIIIEDRIRRRKEKPEDRIEEIQRRFTEEQQCIKTTRKPQISDMEMISNNMEKLSSGPMSLIANCMKENQKIKVVTRDKTKLKGFLIGYVKFYDKHMNLLMYDVFERWRRRRKKSDQSSATTPSLGAEKIAKTDISKVVLERQRQTTIIIKKCRKWEICERYFEGEHLLVRGDMIFTITKL